MATLFNTIHTLTAAALQLAAQVPSISHMLA